MINCIRELRILWIPIIFFIPGFSDASPNDLEFAWVQSWGASQHRTSSNSGKDGARIVEARTLVQRVRLSVGGKALRIKVYNEFGDSPLHIGSASVMILDDVGKESPHALTFAGSAEFTVPPGAPAVSDAVKLKVSPLAEVEVRLFLVGRTDLKTINSGFYKGRISNSISQPGDYSMVQRIPIDEKLNFYAFLSGVDVQANIDTKVLAAFGDSITAGLGPNRSWPDRLAEEFVGTLSSSDSRFAVVNAGIGGNMLLRDDGKSINGLARFDRDVLAITGVSHIVVLLGLNDIGRHHAFSKKHLSVEDRAAAIIAGYRQLVLRARDHGVKIFCATLTPFKGAEKHFEGYYSNEAEKVRQLVNQWLRMNKEFDSVIDLDKVLRDKVNSGALLPEYDSGDHLHPNDKGHVIMASEVKKILLQ